MLKRFLKYSVQPLIIAFLLGLLTFIFGFLSIFTSKNYEWGIDISRDGFIGFADLLFNTMRLVNGNPQYVLEDNLFYAIAQFFAVCFAVTVIYGVLVELSSKFRDFFRLGKFLWYKIRRKDPAFIFGLGKFGLTLAKELCEHKRPVYVISVSDDSEQVLRAERYGALILERDHYDEGTINNITLPKSAEIFVTTENDATNIEIAGLLSDRSSDLYHGYISKRIKGYIHIGDQKMNNTLKMHSLLSEDSSNINWTPFSTLNTTARDLFYQLFLDQQLGILSDTDHEDHQVASEMAKTNDFALPGKNEVFHLFLFGFGEIGQSIALHAAHFAHFESGLRPRITIFGDAETGMKPWELFLERYPAFSPYDLDLSGSDFHEDGDGWDTTRFRPHDREYQTRSEFKKQNIEFPTEQKEGESDADYRKRIKEWEEKLEFRFLQDHAVEYVVNAEYMPILTDIESGTLMDELSKRVTAKQPDVKTAIVFCFDKESRNFKDSLRFQLELARRFFVENEESGLTCCKPGAKKIFPVPIFVHLPFEKGFVKLLKSKSGYDETAINENLPIHIFGERDRISSYSVVTNSEIKNYAEGLREVYETLSGKDSQEHADFESSDMEAAMFAEVKLKTLGITFRKRDKFSPEGIYAEYYWEEVEELYEDWKQKYYSDDKLFAESEIVIPYQTAEELVYKNYDKDAVEKLLIQRLSLLRRIEFIPEGEGTRDSAERDFIITEVDKINELKSSILDEAMDRFESYLNTEASSKGDKCCGLDLVAEMEHNRWMGERLSKNWRFGDRDTHRRFRKSFVPWKLVPTWDNKIINELSSKYQMHIEWTAYKPENMKNYDKQQIPRIIIERRERGFCAFIDK